MDGHSAVITYLFTEVEASARLREHEPERMPPLAVGQTPEMMDLKMSKTHIFDREISRTII